MWKVCIGMAAGLVAVALPQMGMAADGIPASGRYMLINGKRLYVEETGPKNAPTLVFIHGGPGSGAYEFGKFQRERLSDKIHLIQFDQRGALRSDAVGEGEPFTIDNLVADTEALRLALGIKRWSLLAHSFGGLIAVRYALAHPEAVDKLILDNPTIDVSSSNRYMLASIAEKYRELGKDDKVEEAEALAEDYPGGLDGFSKYNRIANGVGNKKMEIFVHSLPKTYLFDWIKESGLPMSTWSKGDGASQRTLWESRGILDDLCPALTGLRMPVLLIRGRYDRTTAPHQLQCFRKNVKGGTLHWFGNSAHFPFAEEPDDYAAVVEEFIQAKEGH